MEIKNKQQQETDTRKQITWQYKVRKSSVVEYATGFVPIFKCDFSFYTRISFNPFVGDFLNTFGQSCKNAPVTSNAHDVILHKAHLFHFPSERLLCKNKCKYSMPNMYIKKSIKHLICLIPMQSLQQAFKGLFHSIAMSAQQRESRGMQRSPPKCSNPKIKVPD